MNIIGSLVSLEGLKNARGYPAVGEVISVKEDLCDVKFWGLYGPGSETTIVNIPVIKLKNEDKKWI